MDANITKVLDQDESAEKKEARKKADQAIAILNQQLFKEDYEKYKPLLTEMDEDVKFSMGDQWSPQDIIEAKAKSMPATVINTIKKVVRLLTGYQKQNYTDSKVFPLEGGDSAGADCLTEVVKFISASNTNKKHICSAFESTIRAGVGWVFVDVRFDKDPLNGDILYRKIPSQFVIPDTGTNSPELEDCQRIHYFKFMTGDEINTVFPGHEEQIKNLRASTDFTEIGAPKNLSIPRFKVIERWYRAYDSVTVADDGMDTRPISKEEETAIRALGEESSHVKLIKRRVMKIKRAVSVEDVLLVHEDSLLGNKYFPFVPIWGDFVEECNDWRWKVQGEVRVLKDPAKMRNKLRSAEMEAVLKQIRSGWFVKKGSVKDTKVFHKPNPIIEYETEIPQKIPQADFPNAIVQLESLWTKDALDSGVSADMLGQMLSKSEPTSSSIHRKNQSLITVQIYFENLGTAKMIITQLTIDYICRKWKDEKFQRILGIDPATGQPKIVPPSIKAKDGFVNYDCVVEEIKESPTYKMMIVDTIMGYMQQGQVQIPPELFLEMIPDIPLDIKTRLAEIIQQQQQMQADAQAKAQADQEQKKTAAAESLARREARNKLDDIEASGEDENGEPQPGGDDNQLM